MENEQQQQESKQDESLRRRMDEERRQMLRSLQAHASLPGPAVVRQGLPPFTSNIPSVAFGWPLTVGHLNYTPSVASAVAASRHGGNPRENPSLAAALDLQKAIELRLLQYQTERIVAEQLEQRRFQQAQLLRQLQHQAASAIPLALGHYPAFAVLQPNSADFLAANSVGAYSAPQDYYNLLGFNNPRGAAALQINPNLRSHGSILPLNNPASSFQPANSLENYHLEQAGYLPQNDRQQEIQQEQNGFSGISPTTEATTSTRASSEVEAKSSTASGCHGNSHPYFRQCSTLEKLFKKGKAEQETLRSAKEKGEINEIQNQTNSIGEEKMSVSRTESELVEIKAKARAFAMLGPVMQGGRKKKQESVQVNSIKNPMPPVTLPEREQLERLNKENRTISNPYKADDENTFQVSETDILNRIPEDASCVFYLFDRKINMDAQPPNASLYSLIRSWVQDDPCRVIPEKSNLMDFVAPSRDYYSMNSNTCTNNNKKRCLDQRKISAGTQSTKPRKVDMMQYLSSTSVNKGKTDKSPDIDDLLKEHVKHAKKIRNKRFSEREVEFQNIRPRLKRLGINV